MLSNKSSLFHLMLYLNFMDPLMLKTSNTYLELISGWGFLYYDSLNNWVHSQALFLGNGTFITWSCTSQLCLFQGRKSGLYGCIKISGHDCTPSAKIRSCMRQCTMLNYIHSRTMFWVKISFHFQSLNKCLEKFSSVMYADSVLEKIGAFWDLMILESFKLNNFFFFENDHDFFVISRCKIQKKRYLPQKVDCWQVLGL